MIRRPPKYHHYWPRLAQMPPLKHSRAGNSEVIDWICKEFEIDKTLAGHVFSSAKQAHYLIMAGGRWHGDAMAGYWHWQQKPSKPDSGPDDKKKILAEIEDVIAAGYSDEKSLKAAIRVVLSGKGITPVPAERVEEVWKWLIESGHLAPDQNG